MRRLSEAVVRRRCQTSQPLFGRLFPPPSPLPIRVGRRKMRYFYYLSLVINIIIIIIIFVVVNIATAAIIDNVIAWNIVIYKNYGFDLRATDDGQKSFCAGTI